MIHVAIRHKVKDFAVWKAAFDGHEETRRSAGCLSAQLFQVADDPNNVILLTEWESAEKVQAFMDSSDLKEVMESSGVIETPSIYLMNKV